MSASEGELVPTGDRRRTRVFIDDEAEVSEDEPLGSDGEEEEDDEAEKKVREGFIVDEAEDEEDPEESDNEVETTKDLTDDDFQLLAENLGIKIRKDRKQDGQGQKRKRLLKTSEAFYEHDAVLSSASEEDEEDTVTAAPLPEDLPSGSIPPDAYRIFGDLTAFLSRSSSQPTHVASATPSKAAPAPVLEARSRQVTSEMVEWAIKHVFPETELLDRESESFTSSAAAVRHALELLRSQELDVPFIAMYRCDEFPFSTRQLWEIERWDRRWDVFAARRAKLRQQLEQRQLGHLVDFASSETDLDDARAFLNHISQTRKSKSLRADPSLAFADALQPVLEHLLPQPHELGVNLRTGYEYHPAPSPAITPQDAAVACLSSSLRTADDVLDHAVRVAAHRLSFDPSVRFIVRRRFMQTALLSTTMTEAGRSFIDSGSKYFTVRALRDKPMDAFNGDTQFLLVLEAETEGLLTVDLHFTADTDAFARELLDVYNSDDQWHELRIQALAVAIAQYLIPLCRHHTRGVLRQDAIERVLSTASQRLREALEIRPLRPTRPVLALSVGEPRAPSQAVLLGPAGDVIDAVVFHQLKTQSRFGGEQLRRDRRSFTALVQTHEPELVLIDASSLDARILHETVEATLIGLDVRVEYMDPFVATVARRTQHYLDEFPGQTEQYRYTVSLGRSRIDMLQELCLLATVCSDVAFLKLHDMQDLVPRSALLSRITQVFRDAVAQVGVDLVQAVRHRHLRGPLQFLPGLTQHRASELVAWTAHRGGITSRADLVDCPVLSDAQRHNLVGFLRLDDPGLDSTRIHPDTYSLAHTLLAGTLQVDPVRVAADPASCMAQVQTPPHRDELDQLDLDAFAAQLSQTERVSARTLHRIRDELKNPFGDHYRTRRLIFSAQRLFELFSGEVVGVTLKEWQIMTVFVTKISTFGVHVKLDNGLPGTVAFNDFAEEAMDIYDSDDRIAFLQSRTSVGAPLRVRIKEIDVDRCEVRFTARKADIDNHRPLDDSIKDDPYSVTEIAHVEMEELAKFLQQPLAPSFQSRPIQHHFFQNIGRHEAETFLSGQNKDDVVLRPSTKGPQCLSATLRLTRDVFWHFSVKEEEKPAGAEMGLGQRLVVGKHEFEDLDDLIYSYLVPVLQLMRQAMKHKYFRVAQDLDEIRDMLEMERNHRRGVPYFICLVKNTNGLFTPGELSFALLGSRRVKSQPIRVDSSGFRLGSAVFKRLDGLIRHMKTQLQQMTPRR